MITTIQEIVKNLSGVDDDFIVFAKKINGHFSPQSEVVLLELTEDEKKISTHDIAQKKCPGFEYFLEVFIIKETVQDLISINPNADFNQIAKQVIHSVEFDA